MSAERQRADVELPAEESRYQSVEASGRFRIYDRRADEPSDSFVEADLDAVLPVGNPDDE